MKLSWIAILLSITLFSCVTGNIVIPTDLTTGELVQKAQEASDKNRYDTAAMYYNAVLERFPNDREAVCGAQYEIAFIHYKQKKYAEAEDELLSLLSLYNAPDGDLLPRKYFILSSTVLENIKNASAKK
ncbi:MAG: outer membrane protein assembly factor BamD [Treponema sp.]|jgi:outer membrane protein assembly factor BamD (BamD/ComL family)|nr:outer membrane protein assembly factor BamD [Treponema sp.]